MLPSQRKTLTLRRTMLGFTKRSHLKHKALPAKVYSMRFKMTLKYVAHVFNTFIYQKKPPMLPKSSGVFLSFRRRKYKTFVVFYIFIYASFTQEEAHLLKVGFWIFPHINLKLTLKVIDKVPGQIVWLHILQRLITYNEGGSDGNTHPHASLSSLFIHYYLMLVNQHLYLFFQNTTFWIQRA